jgi:hypothetical protein
MPASEPPREIAVLQADVLAVVWAAYHNRQLVKMNPTLWHRWRRAHHAFTTASTAETATEWDALVSVSWEVRRVLELELAPKR